MIGQFITLALLITFKESQIEEVRQDLFAPGLAKAEAFRQTLLKRVEDRPMPAESLAEAIIHFRDRADRSLHANGRPNLSGFRDLCSEDIVGAIKGDSPSVERALTAFQQFEGCWFGLWDGREVDHHWSAVETLSQPPEVLNTDFPLIRAKQFAWIGDGFGWNVLVDLPEGGQAILGTVYHVNNQDPGQVHLHRPHVGVAVPGGRLIWITASEVFFEEVFPGPPEQYVITGFFYTTRLDGQIERHGEAFQAIYQRTTSERVPFQRVVLVDGPIMRLPTEQQSK